MALLDHASLASTIRIYQRHFLSDEVTITPHKKKTYLIGPGASICTGTSRAAAAWCFILSYDSFRQELIHTGRLGNTVHSDDIVMELANKDMLWVRLRNDSSCKTCGAKAERYVRLINERRATEVTFCPVCYSEVKKVVDLNDLGRSASDDFSLTKGPDPNRRS